MRYFLKLAYDGTLFHGWQRQPNAISVQEKIEDALTVICQSPVSITGAGRTDTGVHASEMYAHFDGEIKDSPKFIRSLNNMLGDSIAIYDVIKVRDDAHARFDALSRTYIYRISLKKDPFLSKFSHRLHHLPDIDLMNRGGEVLLRTSDFTSFAKLHSDTKTNICKVSEARWIYKMEDELLEFHITADRFLRNMVRSTVGTLLDLGFGKISIPEFEDIIEAKDRCSAGSSMPAKGLFLSKIVYPKETFIL